MAVDRSKFVPAAELLFMLQSVVDQNPDALLMLSNDNGSGYLVIDGFNSDLDSDGDARFSVRDYETGKLHDVVETEESYYQND
jgi:hypothetical protein